MSEIYDPARPSSYDHDASGPLAEQGKAEQGKVDAAKHEASELADVSLEQAGNVAGTARDEAAGVMRETTSQVKDLYAQTQSELKEQAAVQQQRVASGLRALGDELGGMAASSETQGMASDVVRQVSDRAGSIASWLDARDPGSLLTEVKSYARKNPGMFIAVAGLAGLVAGRLTRSLVDGAADAKDEAAAQPAAPAAPVAPAVPVAPALGATHRVPQPVAGYDDTPLYSERASVLGVELDQQGEGVQR